MITKGRDKDHKKRCVSVTFAAAAAVAAAAIAPVAGWSAGLTVDA